MKRERLEVRLTLEEKVLVKRAAALTGQSISDFLATSAMGRAQEVIQARQTLQLTARDSLFLAEAVLHAAAPNKALLAASQRHDELIGP